MLKRKIYGRLLEWKQEKNGSTALMIEGALKGFTLRPGGHCRQSADTQPAKRGANDFYPPNLAGSECANNVLNVHYDTIFHLEMCG